MTTHAPAKVDLDTLILDIRDFLKTEVFPLEAQFFYQADT